MITAELPVDSVQFPPGFYMLFIMVDDIPSVAHIVKALDSIAKINTGTLNKVINLSVYPNPFTKGISIQSAYPLQQFILFDVTGRPIVNQKYKGDDYFDLDNLLEGLYFLKLYFNNVESTVIKLIKLQK